MEKKATAPPCPVLIHPSFSILFFQSYKTTKGCLLSLTPIQHTCPQLCSTSGQMDASVEQRKPYITFPAAFVASAHVACTSNHVSDTHARAQVSGETAKYLHTLVRKHSRVLAGQEIRKIRENDRSRSALNNMWERKHLKMQVATQPAARS